MKIRAAAEIGIVAEHVKLPKTATQHELLTKVCTRLLDLLKNTSSFYFLDSYSCTFLRFVLID